MLPAGRDENIIPLKKNVSSALSPPSQVVPCISFLLVLRLFLTVETPRLVSGSHSQHWLLTFRWPITNLCTKWFHLDSLKTERCPKSCWSQPAWAWKGKKKKETNKQKKQCCQEKRRVGNFWKRGSLHLLFPLSSWLYHWLTRAHCHREAFPLLIPHPNNYQLLYTSAVQTLPNDFCSQTVVFTRKEKSRKM